MTSTITFVTGGCRSGKSSYALILAENLSASPRIYLATCRPQDEEMRNRVARHQADRGDRWVTEEEPLRLPEALSRLRKESGVVLVDCLTLWIANLMLSGAGPDKIEEAAERLVQALSADGCPVVLVSNEVGAGIVPENALARTYRDAVGTVNQRMAACADTVLFMVAGIPLAVKGTVGP